MKDPNIDPLTGEAELLNLLTTNRGKWMTTGGLVASCRVITSRQDAWVELAALLAKGAIEHKRDMASDLWRVPEPGEETKPAAAPTVSVPAVGPNAAEPAMTRPRKPKGKRGETRAKVVAYRAAHPCASSKEIASALGLAHYTMVNYHLRAAAAEGGLPSAPEVDQKAHSPFEGFIAAKREIKAKKSAPRHQPLDAELDQLSRQFAKIEHLPEKVVVLDRLTTLVPPGVATRLAEIRADLIRVGGAAPLL